MELSTENLGGDILKVTLVGRMDIAGTRAIDLKFTGLTATRKAQVIVDLDQVTFLASIGFRTLISNAKALKARGGAMVLARPRPEVKQILTTMGVDQLIPTVGTLDEALTFARGEG